MDFFTKLKRAFGFSSDGDEIDDEVEITPHKSSRSHSAYSRKDEKEQAGTDRHADRPVTDSEAIENADLDEIKRMLAHLTAITEKKEVQAHATTERQEAAPAAPADNAELREKLQVSEAQRRAAQTRANDMSLKIEEMQLAIDSLEVDKKALLNKLRIAQMRAGIVTDAGETDAELDSLVDQQAKIEELTKKVAEQDELTKKLNSELAEAASRLEVAAQVKKRLGEIEQEAKEKDLEIAALREENNQLKEKADSVDEHLRAKLVEAEQQNAIDRETIEQLRQTAKTEAEKQKRRDIHVGNRIDSYKEQLANASRRIEQIQAERDSLAERLAAQEKKHHEAITLRDQLRQLLDQTEADLKAAREQVARMTKELDNLKSQRTSRLAEVEQLSRQVAQLRSDNDSLSERLESQRVQERPQPHKTSTTSISFDDEPEVFFDNVQHEAPPYTPKPAEKSKPDPIVEEIIEPAQEQTVIHAEPQTEPELINDTPDPLPIDSPIEPAQESSPVPDLDTMLDDADWLLPVGPDEVVEPVIEQEEEPEPLAPKSDPRQLSLF